MATPDTLSTAAPVLTENEQLANINADYTERYGFHDAENYLYKAPKGLTRELVAKISEFKSEPQWMRDFRLKALDHFLARKQPTWGSPMLAELDYDNIRYFVRASVRGTTCPRTSSGLLIAWAFRRRSESSCPESAPSTSQRSSTTRFTRTSKSRA